MGGGGGCQFAGGVAARMCRFSMGMFLGVGRGVLLVERGPGGRRGGARRVGAGVCHVDAFREGEDGVRGVVLG